MQAVRVEPLTAPQPRRRFQSLLRQHHYLGGLKAVGEQMYYVAVDAQDRWLALLLFSAAARHLQPRDQWIGWTRARRDRRLAPVVNDSRFLIPPHAHVPNLGSRVLRLALDRLSADWQVRYDHPVLVVETFVDSEQFNGTVYTAQGWQELGLTDGWGRCRRDYYVQHDRPSGCSSAKSPATPDAASRPSTSNLRWRPWKRKRAAGAITRVRKSRPWLSTSKPCPSIASGSNPIRSGSW